MISPMEETSLEQLLVAQLCGADDRADDEFDQAARTQTELARLARRMHDTTDVDRLLADVARATAKALAYDNFGVARLRAKEAVLDFRVGRGLSQGPSAELKTHELPTDPKRSQVAYALDVLHPVIAEDLAEERRFRDEVLRSYGIKSSLVSPIISGERRFGALGVYSTTRREFARSDVLYVDCVAQMLGSSLARQQVEQDFAQQTRFISTAIDSMDGIVLVLGDDGRIVRFNRACETVTGFTQAEARGRAVWSALLIPEEADLVHEAMSRIRRDEGPVKLETTVLTKQGLRRRVAWTFAAVRGDDGRIQAVVASGIDITKQHEALLQLDKFNRPADDVRAATPQGSESPRAARRSDARPENRVQARRAFPYIQTVAPILDDQLPNLKDFREVRCRDISARGFSFLLREPPGFDQVVAAFGAASSRIFLTAKVVHVSPFKYDDRDMHLVGCQYTGRADYSRPNFPTWQASDVRTD